MRSFPAIGGRVRLATIQQAMPPSPPASPQAAGQPHDHRRRARPDDLAANATPCFSPTFSHKSFSCDSIRPQWALPVLRAFLEEAQRGEEVVRRQLVL